MSTTTARLLTYAEAAAETGLSERTIQRHAAAGEIKTVRLGRRSARIHPEELERFISEGPHGNPAPDDPNRDHILALVAKAPPLTTDQVARISAVLRTTK